jgi:hypothetical protein
MSITITIKTAKIIAILSFLMIIVLSENELPNFALLAIWLFQFLSDLSNTGFRIFWEGSIVIPILVALVIFFINKNFKVLLICFLILLISLIHTTGLLNNFFRISFGYVFIFFVFLASSIFVLLKTQKQNILV